MSGSAPGWIEVTVRVDAGRVARAESLLLDSGAVSVTLLDAGDQPVHEPDPGETPLWPVVLVRGLFDPGLDRERVTTDLVADGLVRNPADIDFGELAERDWERAWMDRYEPMRFGNALWICPSHLDPDPDWSVVIRLDPGLAFGTGTHPTTALCLEWIDGHDLAGLTVIDYGCGSGVLAIACALKGARRIIAVDHDRQALEATRNNARRNGLEPLIEACLPADFETMAPPRADVVVANILAGPLIELSNRLTACLAPSGQLVLSGILAEQAETVHRCYSNRLETADRRDRDGWVLLTYQASEPRG